MERGTPHQGNPKKGLHPPFFLFAGGASFGINSIGHRRCKKVTKRHGKKFSDAVPLLRVIRWMRSIVPRQRPLSTEPFCHVRLKALIGTGHSKTSGAKAERDLSCTKGGKRRPVSSSSAPPSFWGEMSLATAARRSASHVREV